MEDLITVQRINSLHPSVREEVMSFYKNGIIPNLKSEAFCRFAYTLRTFDEQDDLYAKGRTKLFDSKGNRLGIVTWAKGGYSFHNYGLAIDIVFIDGYSASWNIVKDFDKDGKADWMEVVSIFEEKGWEWGGRWTKKDYPHFQKTFGYTTSQLLEKYDRNEFIQGTNYIKL